MQAEEFRAELIGHLESMGHEAGIVEKLPPGAVASEEHPEWYTDGMDPDSAAASVADQIDQEAPEEATIRITEPAWQEGDSMTGAFYSFAWAAYQSDVSG